MPELPEVETVRRGLAPVVEGSRIVRVELRRPDLRFPFPPRFAERLEGRRIESLGRRAKYLLAALEGDLVLAMHLGMSGSFRIEAPLSAAAGRIEVPPPAASGIAVEQDVVPGLFHHPRSTARSHDHVLFRLGTADGQSVSVVFNDPRRFGFMTLLAAAEFGAHPHFRDLGIEPTGDALSGEALAPLFAGRAAPLKAVLLDQTIIAGLGNIYVCEALWRARLSPRRAAGTLVLRDGRASERLGRLAGHVRETIADAILAGGSTLRDHRQTDGSLGLFQHRFAVYDRRGEPCPREGCRGVVQRIVQSGRSTFFCPLCQR